MKVHELLENKIDAVSLLKKQDFAITTDDQEIDAEKEHPSGFLEKYVVNSDTQSWRYEVLLNGEVGKTHYGEGFSSLKKHVQRKSRFSEKSAKKYFS